jgi:hypothetical protein
LWRAAKALKAESVSEDLWDVWLDAWRNKWDMPGTSVNEVFINGKVISSAVKFRKPRFVLTPHNDWQMWFHAKIAERALNFLADKLELGRLTEELCMQCYCCGRGFLKAGYASFWQQTKGGGKRVEKFAGYSMALPGMPWMASVDPRDVWLLGGGRWEDVRFVFQRVCRPAEEVLGDKRYDSVVVKRKLGRGKGKGKGYWPSGDAVGGRQGGVEDWPMVEMVEVWDKYRGVYGVMLGGDEQGVGGWLLKPRKWYWWPWISMAWNDFGVGLWPVSDVQQIWPQQLEINRVREQLRRHGLIALLKVLVQQDMISEDDLDAFFGNEVGVHVPVRGNPRDAVSFFSPPIPQELFQLLSEARLDIRRILGHNENVTGAYVAKARATATETQQVAGGTELRISDRRHAIRCVLRWAGQWLLNCVMDVWGDSVDGQRSMVRTPNGMPVSVRWSMADLGDVVEDLEFFVEDKAPLTSGDEKAKIAEAMNWAVQMQQAGGGGGGDLKRLSGEYFGGMMAGGQGQGQRQVQGQGQEGGL